MSQIRIRIGGLLRCTINTVREETSKQPQPGDVITCRHCPQRVVFHDGAWQWDHSRDSS